MLRQSQLSFRSDGSGHHVPAGTCLGRPRRSRYRARPAPNCDGWINGGLSVRFWGVIFVGLLWIPAYEMFFSDGTRHSPTSAWMVAGGFICFAIAAQVGRDWAVETMRCWSWFAIPCYSCW